MPTVIDSIQIEIQSGSTNAASGIDSLSKSLEKLKNSGKITTVVKNLHSLSDSLKGFTDASGSASSLHRLANAIERLKGVGSIASITNNLTKLPTALKSIGDVDMDRVAPQLQEIADAARPLTEIKTSGLNGMVNALSKIKKVTADLGKEEIAAFAARVKELNEILGPLSEKMTTIKAGFGAINTGANKAAKAVHTFKQGVNTTTLNLSSFIEVARTAAQTVANLVHQTVEFLHAAIGWDGVVAQFGNAFGDQADEYYDKITMITEALDINKQAFMENSAMSASMLIGFGVDAADAREMGLGYTELAYDVWAAYNNVYQTLDGADGAMAAIRSAIAGEVEPIRRAGFTIVESTLEQTAANHGLQISIENATEAQKSYLRYLTLVDQAQSKGIIGTYAREMNTAEGMMRTFSQQMKSLAQAMGSLFLPILVKVMPYVQAFVELLTEGVHAIAALFGVKIQDIGDTWNSYSTGVDEAVEGTNGVTDALGNAAKAAKELKNASIGIDELNVISPPSASSGSGGSGEAGAGGGGFSGLDVESLWDESVFNEVKSQVDAIKEKLKGWLPEIAAIASALGGIHLAKMVDDLDLSDTKLSKFESKIKGLAKGLAVATVTIAVGTLIWDFTGAYLDEGGIKNLGKMLGTTIIGAAIGAWLGKSVGAGLVIAASGIVSLTKLGVELKEGSVSITDPEALVTMVVGALEAILGGALLIDGLKGGKWTKSIGTALKSGLETVALKGMFAFDGVKAFLTPLVTKITSALSGIGAAIAAVPGWVAAVVAALVGVLILGIVDYDFTEVGRKVGEAIGKACRVVVDFAADIGKPIIDGVVAAFEWCKENFTWENVKEFVGFIFDPKSWTEIIFPKMVEIGGNILEGLWEGISGWAVNLWNNLTEFFDGFIQGFKDAFGIASPAKKFIEIGEYIIAGLVKPLSIDTIKNKISDMWESAKTWWSKKPALSEYTPKIGDIKAKVSSAWDSAKKWYDSKKAALKEYTPSIGSIYDKMKTRWDNARTWWNDKKTKAKEYTPSIGSIYEKMKERWDNARTWWNNKKTAAKTYTPSIGSIKDKLVSAWNTAKSWWNKNVGGLSTKLDIKVPKISVNWATASAFGKEFRYPTGFKLDFAANGGVFDAGSLIWAGERGAEILANAGGGRTGVMNVEQMQEAVYEGVYAAVTAAMSRHSGGGQQGVNVYLDSRQITSTVEQRQREKGASLMGNEVFSH